MSWASPNPDIETSPSSSAPTLEAVPFAVQLVRQVNFGPLESKRYFAPDGTAFVEVGERALVDANFKKLNSCVLGRRGGKEGRCSSRARFKNFRCAAHNRFFEVNVYQLDPVNSHHWRADVARPGTEIDL